MIYANAVKNNLCPICGYKFKKIIYDNNGDLEADFDICPSCGFEFAVTDIDLGFTYDSWRAKWIMEGMLWANGEGNNNPPADWDPVKQLADLGFELN